MSPTPSFSLILLDYGHGGKIGGVYQTPNAKQYLFNEREPHTWVGEGIINRMIAFLLIGRLRTMGFRVFDVVAGIEWSATPSSWMKLEQADVSLDKRVANANKHKQDSFFLSLHSNASGNGLSGPSQSARGCEFYTSVGQTKSDEVATSLYESFVKRIAPAGMPIRKGDWSDKDADYESNFYVLRNTAMPAVLGEAGFFTNIEDARFLMSSEGQTLIAEAYAEGLRPWKRVT